MLTKRHYKDKVIKIKRAYLIPIGGGSKLGRVESVNEEGGLYMRVGGDQITPTSSISQVKLPGRPSSPPLLIYTDLS